MKQLKVWTLLIFLISAGAAGAGEAKPGGGLKIGWVDLDKLFRGYFKTEKSLTILEDDLKAKEDEIRILGVKIQTMEKEKELLSESGRKKKDGEIAEQKMALLKLRREAELDLNKKIVTEKEKLLEEILAKIEEKAGAEGYDFIFRGELMVYKDPARDLTDEILKKLNEGREAPAPESKQ